jgi:hypothetical protein
MRTIQISDDYQTAASKLIGQFPDRSHATEILNSDARLIASGGIIPAVLLCHVIPVALLHRAFELCKDVPDRPSNRPAAMGTHSLPRSIGLDGSPSPRTGVNKLLLDASEAYDGRLGWDGPNKETKLTDRHREMLIGNERLIERVDTLYQQYLPIPYAKQQATIERVPRCHLFKTVFTTLYIAKNFRTAYHRDGNNLSEAMRCLVPTGRFEGGELVLPRFRIAIAFRPGDVLLFDPGQVHGNLPFTGDRISLAMYCGGWAAKCR